MHPTRFRPDQSPRSVRPAARRAITSLLAGCLMLAGFVLGADDMLAQEEPSTPATQCERVDDDDIWGMDDTGGNARYLTNNAAHQFAPRWSSQGAEIEFSTDRDCDDEIYSMHVDGSAPRNLRNSPGPERVPPWTPSAEQVTFASGRPIPAATETGGAASPVAGAVPVAVEDLPPCLSQIEMTDTIWTLQGDCQTDATINLEDGGTLDGNGHTIWVVKPERGVFIGNVIDRIGGSASVTNLTISGAELSEPCGTGQWLGGIRFVGVNGTISGVTIQHLTQGTDNYCGTGIVVEGLPGAEGDEQASTRVENNSIQNVGFIGILVRDRVETIVSNNTVIGAKFRGIYFRGPDVTGAATNNVLVQVEEIGLAVAAGQGVPIAENTVVAAYAAVLIDTGATGVEIYNNRIRDGRYGIVFDHAGTSGTVAANKITSVTDYGIIAFRAEMTVTGNTISGGDTGVGGVRGARIEAIGNEIAGAGVGLGIVGAGSRGHFAANTIRDVTQYGIYVGDDAEATVESNHVVDAAGGAIVVNAGRGTVRGNSTIGGSIGVWVLKAGRPGSVTGNTVVQPESFGIAIIEGAEATVSENTVEGAGAHAILIADPSTRATVDGNTVTNAAEAGILVTLGAHVPVRGNHVTGPGVDVSGNEKLVAIAFNPDTGGSIIGNTIVGYPAGGQIHGCSVVIAAGAGHVDIRDNQFLDVDSEHNICEEWIDRGTPMATPTERN